MGKGVYFAVTEDVEPRNLSVQIVKECPHLDEDGSCNAQEFKPKACENEQFGGDLCDDKRLVVSLPTVNKMLATEARRAQRIKDLQDFADALGM